VTTVVALVIVPGPEDEKTTPSFGTTCPNLSRTVHVTM
jgi:hypothetical protein